MDNNNNSFNPEVIPEPAIELTGSIPEINTIGPINSLDEINMPTAPVVTGAFSDTPATVIEPTGDICQQAFNAGYKAASVPQTAAVVPVSRTGENLAVAGFIVGLCSLVMTWSAPMCYLCLIASIVAIVLSAVAKKKGVVDGFQKAGVTLAIIGLIFSIITSVSCAACSSLMTNAMEDYIESNPELSEIIGSGDSEALEEYFGQYLSENGFQMTEDGFEYGFEYGYDYNFDFGE